MEALVNPRWETVTAEMRAIMRHIGQCPFAARFYLAGGTALALQLGHRRSVDLDFFSETDEVPARTSAEIIAALAPLTPVVMENSYGNLLLRIGATYTGFFSYGYPLLDPLVTVEEVTVAGLRDIGLMKLIDVSWEQVKQFFIAEAKWFRREWFDF